jgi:excisionase family DNA binding protein
MTEDTQMLNPRQVAEILGVHQKTVHLWLRSGRLQGIKISYRAWRIPQSALDTFITSNSNTRSKPQTVILPANNGEISNTSQATIQTEIQKGNEKKDDASPQIRMKHYIRNIMGEHPPEE